MSDHTTRPTPQKIPYGYCHCGCGQMTPIANQTRPKLGHVKGQPQRFVKGHSSPTYASLADGLWAHCSPSAPDECWEWQGHRTPQGYGVFRYQGKTHKAHRASWEAHFGPIPEGMGVLHKCDNPPCCNPNHLFLGTQVDNNADMVAKDRQCKQQGQQNGNAKLTDSEVIKIRKMHQSGETTTDIAKLLNLPRTTVGRIVRYQSWKHVP